jgi:hypothetical protein
MKIILFISLLFTCVTFIAFNHSASADINSHYVSGRKNFDEYFTKYNPEFVSKGLMKSSFKHEVTLNR